MSETCDKCGLQGPRCAGSEKSACKRMQRLKQERDEARSKLRNMEHVMQTLHSQRLSGKLGLEGTAILEMLSGDSGVQLDAIRRSAARRLGADDAYFWTREADDE